MSEFKKYKRVQIAELREVDEVDLCIFEQDGFIMDLESMLKISISDYDLKNGSPKIGDMIARNPNNHNDQWLVSKDYFDANFSQFSRKIYNND